MKMFDTVISSYDFGPSFHVCQTKSLSNLMDTYWISPLGEIYSINYDGTQSFEYELDNDTSLCKNVKLVSNGTHGKVRPFKFYGMIEIYPEKWDSQWTPYPRLTLYIEDGKLKEFRNMTKNDLHL